MIPPPPALGYMKSRTASAATLLAVALLAVTAILTANYQPGYAQDTCDDSSNALSFWAATASTSTLAALVADCNALLNAESALAGAGSLNWDLAWGCNSGAA